MSLPPPHPSLPKPPVDAPQPSNISYGYAYPACYSYSSHYAQAYYPQMALQSASQSYGTATSKSKEMPVHLMSTWYQAGNVRCSYPGCGFRGSHKSVEIHKMDRHLIYPPDWDKRKKKSEWDADPSLKGKRIPIQGTNVVLDTPELIDRWINERKGRFPSSTRVEEKKRKLAEANERGQLDLNLSLSMRSHKRQKFDPPTASVRANHRGLKRHNSRAMINENSNIVKKTKEGVAITTSLLPKNTDNESDVDAGPEELSSKIPELDHIDTTPSSCLQSARPRDRKKRKEPHPPHNPFASRPDLMRSLLQPEIRITISNLSQAIRFLVDNEFLHNVELEPGQAAEEQKIVEVLPNSF